MAEAGDKLGDKLGIDWECPILAQLEELPPGDSAAVAGAAGELLLPDHLQLPAEALEAPWSAVAAATAATPYTKALKEGHDATAGVEAEEGGVTSVRLASDTSGDSADGEGLGTEGEEGDEESEGPSGTGGVTGVTGVASRLVRQVTTALARRLSLDAPQARCSSIVDEDKVEEAAVAAVSAVVAAAAAAKDTPGEAESSLAAWLAAHQLGRHLGDKVTDELPSDEVGYTSVEQSDSSFGSFSSEAPVGEDFDAVLHEDQQQLQDIYAGKTGRIVPLPHWSAGGAVITAAGAAAAAAGVGRDAVGLVGKPHGSQQQQEEKEGGKSAVHTMAVRGGLDEGGHLLEELMTPAGGCISHQPAATAATFAAADDSKASSHHQLHPQQQAAKAAAAGGDWFFCISPDACNNPIYYWVGNADMDAVKFDLDTAAGPYKIDLGKTLYAGSLWPDNKVRKVETDDLPLFA